MWDCVECWCKNIAAGLGWCPQCGKEKQVPKVTVGGVSNASVEDEPGFVAQAAPVVPAAAVAEAAQVVEAPAEEPAAEPVADAPAEAEPDASVPVEPVKPAKKTAARKTAAGVPAVDPVPAAAEG